MLLSRVFLLLLSAFVTWLGFDMVRVSAAGTEVHTVSIEAVERDGVGAARYLDITGGLTDGSYVYSYLESTGTVTEVIYPVASGDTWAGMFDGSPTTIHVLVRDDGIRGDCHRSDDCVQSGPADVRGVTRVGWNALDRETRELLEDVDYQIAGDVVFLDLGSAPASAGSGLLVLLLGVGLGLVVVGPPVVGAWRARGGGRPDPAVSSGLAARVAEAERAGEERVLLAARCRDGEGLPGVLVVSNRRMVLYRTKPSKVAGAARLAAKGIEMIPFAFLLTDTVRLVRDASRSFYPPSTRRSGRALEADGTRLLDGDVPWSVTATMELAEMPRYAEKVEVRGFWFSAQCVAEVTPRPDAEEVVLPGLVFDDPTLLPRFGAWLSGVDDQLRERGWRVELKRRRAALHFDGAGQAGAPASSGGDEAAYLSTGNAVSAG